MRAILVDWLVDVHLKFKMVPETLFVCVSLIDRYLEKVPVTRQYLQLVGVTAMFIASKYEEIYPPQIKDFIEVTDNSYTRAEVLQMEGSILEILEFNLTSPSPYRFMERYARVLDLDAKTTMLARFILELSLVDL
jgi:hypothetical protein